MASLDDDFKKVLTEFTKKLKPEELAGFRVTTLVELEKAAYDLQEAQRKTKTARNLKKIEPFLQAMSQYKGVIEVFLNTSSLLCFIWGPMKSMLLVR
jgi:DNA-binding Lrp family transcriptional regulator